MYACNSQYVFISDDNFPISATIAWPQVTACAIKGVIDTMFSYPEIHKENESEGTMEFYSTSCYPSAFPV